MDYRQTVRWMLSFADFERSGRFRDRPDVAPMLELLARLGDPHIGRRAVHITGTKGKGSVAAMVESILRAAGYRTGLYTSPHLHTYRERVRINGELITPEGFARLGTALRRAVEQSPPDAGRALVTFDLLTALGFLAFREADVQAQVIEVGLGGRVDSTNVFETKEVAVITPISLEHTEVLGHTIDEIAREKAAIIRPGCTVVLAPQRHSEAGAVVREFAAMSKAPVVDVAADYRWRGERRELRRQHIEIEWAGRRLKARLRLLGAHQAENAATAVACIDALREHGAHVPEDSIPEGLAIVDWPARFEVLTETPLLIADGAHNRDSAARLRESLAEYAGERPVVFVVGSSAGKDIEGLAEELAPLGERALAVRADHPRAMEPARVADAFESRGVPAEVEENVGKAIERALAESGSGGVICVTGSLFVAAEARERLRLAEKERL